YRWLFDPVRVPALFLDFANPETLGRYRPLTKLLLRAIGLLGLDARLPSRIVCLALVTATASALAALVRRFGGGALAGLVAGLVFLSTERMLWAGTFVTFWGVELYLFFACLAIAAFERATRETEPRAAAGAIGATAAALLSFELAVNVPVALAALA